MNGISLVVDTPDHRTDEPRRSNRMSVAVQQPGRGDSGVLTPRQEPITLLASADHFPGQSLRNLEIFGLTHRAW
jgi:hypothetical protein